MNPSILASAAQRDLRALQAYMAQENIQLRVGCLPRSGQPVPGWLIIPTLDIPEKTSLIGRVPEPCG
jgi:hypothetical protein